MLRRFLADYRGALARLGPDARRYLTAVALTSLARQAFGVLRNLYLKELDIGEDRIGLVLSAISLGQAAVSLPAIFVMARLGLRRGLLAALLLEGAASFALAGSQAYAPILAASVVSGAAATLAGVIGQPFLLKACAPTERPYVFSLAFTSGMVAAALGSAMGGGLATLFGALLGDPGAGFRAALAVAALAYAAALPLLLRLERDEPAAREAPPWRFAAPERLLLVCAPDALIGLGAGLTIPFLQIYFRNTFDQTPFAIGVIYTLGTAGMALGYIASPALALRYGARRVIVVSQALSVLFLIELAFPHGLPLAILAFVARTTLMNLCAPIHSQYTLELVDPADQLAAGSVISLVRGVTWAIASTVGGRLLAARAGDFTLAISFTAILYIAATLVGARVYMRLERTRARG